MTKLPKASDVSEAIYDNLSTNELQELINKAQAGDQAALDKLCEQFKPLVEATARSYSFYSVLKEDGISIVWIIFIEFILSYDKPIGPTFPGYIKAHLHGRLIDRLDELGILDPHLLYDNLESLKERSAASFEIQLANNSQLLQAINSLNDKEKELIYLYYMENRSLNEIAALQNENSKTVWSRHHRVLKKLKKILNKNY